METQRKGRRLPAKERDPGREHIRPHRELGLEPSGTARKPISVGDATQALGLRFGGPRNARRDPASKLNIRTRELINTSELQINTSVSRAQPCLVHGLTLQTGPDSPLEKYFYVVVFTKSHKRRFYCHHWNGSQY